MAEEKHGRLRLGSTPSGTLPERLRSAPQFLVQAFYLEAFSGICEENCLFGHDVSMHDPTHATIAHTGHEHFPRMDLHTPGTIKCTFADARLPEHTAHRSLYAIVTTIMMVVDGQYHYKYQH